MSFQALFEQAKIKKIAIIDDDLRTNITQTDVVESSPNEDDLNSLSDIDDQDHIALRQFLTEKTLPHNSVDEMLAALESEDTRNSAPQRYRTMANRVLTRREGFASRVRLIKEWLETDGGIKPSNIKIFTSPESVDLTQQFDLILIDYFLVNNSKVHTIPLIKSFLEAHQNNKNPLLVILMSSHGDELRMDFTKLRPELQRTSSRFRLMLKPSLTSEEDKTSWHYTFEQLAHERKVVIPIEKFIQAWSEKLNAATKELTDGLWALDAHSLDILAKSANADHLSLEEYFGDVFSRRILAEVEQIDFPEVETNALTKALSEITNTNLCSEIGDSRAALRKVVVDIAWHRKNWWKPKKSFPKKDATKQFEWFKRNLRFGTVLRQKRTSDYFVNITQPCDIAHLKLADLKSNHLLIIPGTEDVLHTTVTKGNKFAYSASFDKGSDCVNIKWGLRQPRTPSIQDFIKEANKYEIVGQMRQDQAQEISAQFASLTSRVGTIRTPSFGTFHGYVFGITGEGDDAVWSIKSEKLIAHTYPSGDKDKQIINFDLSNAHKTLDPLGAIPLKENFIRKLVEGVVINLSSTTAATIIQNKLKCAYASEHLNIADLQTHADLAKNRSDGTAGIHFILFWPAISQ